MKSRDYTPWKLELYYRLRKKFLTNKPFEIGSPKKILLCNQGSLGDVFLTTCLIPPLKTLFAGAQIGMLITKKGAPAVKDCPGVDEIHIFDPWFDHKYSKKEKLVRRMRFEKTQYDYDLAICTSPYYSGIGSTLFSIPNRICFDTIGDKIYFNKILPLENRYIGKQYNRLLDLFGAGALACPWPISSEKKETVIFHMHSSTKEKEHPVEFWKDLAHTYRQKGKKILFTGKGRKDEVASVAKPEENVVDALSFGEFVKIISSADYLLTVDTVALHIAEIVGTPHKAFFQKPSKLWDPR